MEKLSDRVIDIAKRRGFFWPAFEIYQGCAGFYTYGPLGVLLKLNMERVIRNWFVREEGCLLLEAPTLTTEDPWVASGHVKSFTDMTIECEKCGEAYKGEQITGEELGLKETQELIEKKKIKCPKCGGKLGSPYDYNLMFKTYIGPGKSKISGYLRPETAQTTYMDFKRLYDIARKQIPFGVIQFGKSFRNEISPRKGLIRLREFSQAEVQFFVNPKEKKHPKFKEIEDFVVNVLERQGTVKRVRMGDLVKHGLSEWIAYFLARSIQLFEKMGIDKNKLRCRQHTETELAFYSKDTWDVEFLSETFGRVELVGIADRTDYDLKRHQDLSKQDMSVNGAIPHVIEVAYGIDRPLYCVMESCIKKDNDRIYFEFPPNIAPYQVAVFPLVSKDKLPEKALEVYKLLFNSGFLVLYDEGFIGKVYYRQDEAGTPFCVTIDYDTLKNGDVTIRNRDNQKQVRVLIKDLPEVLGKLFKKEIEFEKAGKVFK